MRRRNRCGPSWLSRLRIARMADVHGQQGKDHDCCLRTLTEQASSVGLPYPSDGRARLRAVEWGYLGPIVPRRRRRCRSVLEQVALYRDRSLGEAEKQQLGRAKNVRPRPLLLERRPKQGRTPVRQVRGVRRVGGREWRHGKCWWRRQQRREHCEWAECGSRAGAGSA